MKPRPLPPRPANAFLATYPRFDDDAYLNALRFPLNLTIDGDRHRVIEDDPDPVRHECEVFYLGTERDRRTWFGPLPDAELWETWCPVCVRVWPFNFEAEAHGFAAIHEQEKA